MALEAAPGAGQAALGSEMSLPPLGWVGKQQLRGHQRSCSFPAQAGLVQGKTAAIWSESKVLESTNAAVGRRNLSAGNTQGKSPFITRICMSIAAENAWKGGWALLPSRNVL